MLCVCKDIQVTHLHRKQSATNSYSYNEMQFSDHGLFHLYGPYGSTTWKSPFTPVIQYNTIQYNTTQHNTTQHNTTQHNTTQHNTTQHNTTQHNTTQHNTTQHNTTQHNTIQYNTIQFISSWFSYLFNNYKHLYYVTIISSKSAWAWWPNKPFGRTWKRPLNEMQFSDRVRIENHLFHLYEPYGSTTCEAPFTPVRREKYSKCT